MITQVVMYGSHVTVRKRDVNMVGFKLIQLYGQGTFIILLGLLIVTQVLSC